MIELVLRTYGLREGWTSWRARHLMGAVAIAVGMVIVLSAAGRQGHVPGHLMVVSLWVATAVACWGVLAPAVAQTVRPRHH